MNLTINAYTPAKPYLSPPSQPRSSIRCCFWKFRRLNCQRMAAVGAVTTIEPVAGETDSLCSLARYLILLRHAESSWDNPTLRDHARPLSRTGENDSAKLSIKLQRLGWIPQLILCSDAWRTRETLRIMQANARLFLDTEVRYVPSFYSVAAMDGQTAEHIQEAVCKYSSDEIVTVMCMGHNRGWEEAASMFTGTSIKLKTCNAALLEAAGKSWKEAFSSAGNGGWRLLGIVKPDD